jgi:hypothetical protein
MDELRRPEADADSSAVHRLCGSISGSIVAADPGRCAGFQHRRASELGQGGSDAGPGRGGGFRRLRGCLQGRPGGQRVGSVLSQGRVPGVSVHEDDADRGGAKWQDLLATVQRFDAFQQRRNDGRTLHEFLSACDAYSSPLSDPPRLSEIAPLRPTAPSLDSLLRGQDAVRIVLTGFWSPPPRPLPDAASCWGWQKRGVWLTIKPAACDARVADGRADGRRQPVPGRAVGRTGDRCVAENLHWSARIFRYPVALMARQGKAAVRRLLGWLMENPDPGRGPGATRSGTRPVVRVRRAVDRPLPIPVSGTRGAGRDVRPCPLCGRAGCVSGSTAAPADSGLGRRGPHGARGLVPEQPTARPSAGHLRRRHAGCRGHGDRHRFGHDGRHRRHGGVAGLGRRGQRRSGPDLGRFDHLQLRRIAEQAYDQWREQRRQELAAHLQANFADPLFASWRECLEQLDEATIDRCAEACAELTGLAKKLGVSR